MLGLTAGGFVLLAFALLLLFSPGSRIRLVIAAVLGTALPMAAAIASGLANLGSSVAPVFNSLSGLGG